MKIPLKKMNHAEHKKAWMDLHEIEGGKEYNSYEHAAYYVLFVLVLIFIFFQVIRSLV